MLSYDFELLKLSGIFATWFKHAFDVHIGRVWEQGVHAEGEYDVYGDFDLLIQPNPENDRRREADKIRPPWYSLTSLGYFESRLTFSPSSPLLSWWQIFPSSCHYQKAPWRVVDTAPKQTRLMVLLFPWVLGGMGEKQSSDGAEDGVVEGLRTGMVDGSIRSYCH